MIVILLFVLYNCTVCSIIAEKCTVGQQRVYVSHTYCNALYKWTNERERRISFYYNMTGVLSSRTSYCTCYLLCIIFDCDINKMKVSRNNYFFVISGIICKAVNPILLCALQYSIMEVYSSRARYEKSNLFILSIMNE
jgi:hypothetical protein